MIDLYAERDAAANLLERRWFSSIAAARAMQTECEVLREVMEIAAAAWRRARTQLAAIESLRDALDAELSALDTVQGSVAPAATLRVMSAA